MENKFAELAGTGERAYTKALSVLLKDREIQPLVLEALANLTPGLRLRGEFEIAREKQLGDGSIPDLVLESQDTLLLLESKIAAALTRHQRRDYLQNVIEDPHPIKGLIFLVPEAGITEYECHVAGLAGCQTIREAQTILRKEGVILHLMTWNELAQEIRGNPRDLSPQAKEWVDQFLDFIGQGISEVGDEAEEAIPIAEEQVRELSEKSLGELLLLGKRILEVVKESLWDLEDKYRFDHKKKPRTGTAHRIVLLGPRNREVADISVGIFPELAAKFGKSLLWITWDEYDTNEIEVKSKVDFLKDNQIDAEYIRYKFEDEDEAYYLIGVPIFINKTDNLWREKDIFTDIFDKLFQVLLR